RDASTAAPSSSALSPARAGSRSIDDGLRSVTSCVELVAEVRWAEFRTPVTRGEATLTGPGGATLRTRVADGVVRFDCPEDWRACRLSVDHPGAESASVDISVPMSEPRIVELVPRHAIAGCVTRADSGAPIRGAEAEATSARPSPFGAVETDGGGRFLLPVEEPGKQTLLVVAEGFAPQWVDIDVRRAGETRVAIELDDAFEVLVHVTDDDGQPLHGARVTPRSGSGSISFFDHRFSVITDGAGRAMVPRVSRRSPPKLWVSCVGYVARSDLQPEVPDGVRRGELSVVLDRATGDPRAVEGRVTDTRGRPLEGITLRWRSSSTVHFGPRGVENPGDVAVTADDGSYRFDFLDDDGEGVLSVGGRGYAPQILWHAVSGPSPNPARHDFQLELGHWLGGIVRDENGAPVAGASLRIAPRHVDLRVNPENGATTETDDEGRFLVDGLPDSQMSMEIDPPPGRSFSVCVPPNPLELDRSIELVLRDRGEIRGRVVDAMSGDPVAEFSVQYQPMGRGMWDQRARHFDDPHGRFRWASVDRSYSAGIRVHAEGYATAELDPVVPFRSGEEGEVEIALRRARTVRGRVARESDGLPLAAVRVVAGVWRFPGEMDWSQWFWTSMRNYQERRTDEQGEFEFEDDGETSLFIIHSGYRRVVVWAAEMERQIDRAGRVDIALRPGVTLRGALSAEWTFDGASIGLSFVHDSAKAGYPMETPYGYDRLSADGSFVWPDLGPGRYELTVIRRGAGLDRRYYRTVDIEEDDRTIEFTTKEGSLTLAGRLVDAQGRPLDGYVLYLRPENSRGVTAQSCFIDAGREGRFIFEDLGPGVYSLDARVWNQSRFDFPSITLSSDLEKDLVLESPR
ncbi:MAG: carboxypeptidase regulatory-like domain-containing protein, partial [Planctomycetes bacterium]|nr:carboxypeptidase regulatory-like domain-containing protein [Planctomycetota bacterium]